MGYTLPDGTTVQWIVFSGRRGMSSADVWDTAVWGNASWDGGSQIDFKQIPESLIHSIRIRSGKDRFGKRFRTSSAVMLIDNQLGLSSSLSTLLQPGDYVWIRPFIQTAAAKPDIVVPPGTQWVDQVANMWTSAGDLILSDSQTPQVSTSEDQWYGRVDEAVDTVMGGVDVTRVTCYDGFAELAAVDKDAQLEQGVGEDVFFRVSRIGNNASPAFGGAFSSSAPGEATMQATTLAKNALEEMQLTVESEGGDMWAFRGPAIQGKAGVEVRGRDWLTLDSRSTNVQYVFGTPNGIGIRDARPNREAALLVNEATYSNAGGVAQSASDAASLQRYGPRTTRRLDLVAEADAQAQFLATRVVNNLKNVRPRVRSVTVTVVDEQSAFFGNQAEFGDLVMVTVASIHGWSSAFLTHIVGISHEIGEQNWVVTLTLDDAFVDNVDGSYSSAYSGAYRLGG